MAQGELFVRPHVRRRPGGELVLVHGHRRHAPVYYSSGTNHVGQIRAHADVGHPIGVSARELTDAAVEELKRAGVPVFVDSGAFGEIDRSGVVVRPMGPRDWEDVLRRYEDLAASGAQVSVVAPDRVGDQAHTLNLLSTYQGRLRELAARGARVLVPMQRGAMSLHDFYRRVRDVLGFDFTPAIPSSKLAAPIEEVEQLVARERPADVHLLGRGPRRGTTAGIIERLAAAAPGMDFTLDSNLALAQNVAGRVGYAARRHGEALGLSGEDLARFQSRTTLDMLWRKDAGILNPPVLYPQLAHTYGEMQEKGLIEVRPGYWMTPDDATRKARPVLQLIESIQQAGPIRRGYRVDPDDGA